MEITPTLNFGGSCAEAIKMYEAAFGGEITCLITYREADDPEWNALLREEQRDYVYHAELRLGCTRILMSDHVDIEFTTCYTNFLTVIFDTSEEVVRAYDLMKEGSTTIYPLMPTAFCPLRVVFVDRFGIRWGLMTE